MSQRALNSRQAIESCTLHIHNWKPFQLEPCSNGFQSKRLCLSDRSTAPPFIENLDISKLTIMEEEKPLPVQHEKKDRLRLIARKRRRRGSRSVSGRSSDRSGTRRASAAHATCSDFPVAVGTDSSGELFVNSDLNWGSDVSDHRFTRKEERENVGFSSFQFVGLDFQGNESGYGSEPGYRGDGELGYGDEFDEEEEDFNSRISFWGEKSQDVDGMEVGDCIFSEQKVYHRCRRRKNDWKMFAPSR